MLSAADRRIWRCGTTLKWAGAAPHNSRRSSTTSTWFKKSFLEALLSLV